MSMEKLNGNPNSEALNWLLEMELIQSPQVLNAMILNVFRMVKGVADTEFVIDVDNKKLLIYLKLTWWSNKFRRKQIEEQILELFSSVLPNFRFRVTFDRIIVEKALKLMKDRQVVNLPEKEK